MCCGSRVRGRVQTRGESKSPAARGAVLEVLWVCGANSEWGITIVMLEEASERCTE